MIHSYDTRVIGQSIDIEVGDKASYLSMDLEQFFSGNKNSGLGPELSFSADSNSVSDLEKALTEVLSNPKHL